MIQPAKAYPSLSVIINPPHILHNQYAWYNPTNITVYFILLFKFITSHQQFARHKPANIAISNDAKNSFHPSN